MIAMKQNADGSMGMQGADLDDGAYVVVAIPYTSNTPLAQSVAVMNRRMVVKAIHLLPDVASTNAVTVSAYQAPSGTAIGSGTVLHSGTGNLQGTANTNQALTVTAANALVLAGARLGVVISGAMGAAGSGSINFTLAPA